MKNETEYFFLILLKSALESEQIKSENGTRFIIMKISQKAFKPRFPLMHVPNYLLPSSII